MNFSTGDSHGLKNVKPYKLLRTSQGFLDGNCVSLDPHLLISLISIHEFVLITNSSGSDCHTFSSVVYFGLRGNTKWLSMILPRKEYLPNTSCTPLYEKPQRNFIVCHKWSTYSYFLASKQCVCALHYRLKTDKQRHLCLNWPRCVQNLAR